MSEHERRPNQSERAILLQWVAVGDDDDLPTEERRDRNQPLFLGNGAVGIGQPLLYVGIPATYLGNGRGVDWYLVGWIDDGPSLATAHITELSETGSVVNTRGRRE